jgi:hypothetical protein
MDYETALSLGGKENYYDGRHHICFDLPDGSTLELDFGPDGVTTVDLTIEDIEYRLRGGNG